jgi:hypothetical protein
MSTQQDQINAIYPLTYVVVSGDWILKIADKYAIEGVDRNTRKEEIIEANKDLLLPRSGLNSLDELLVGPDFILAGDNLIIPPHQLPSSPSPLEPILLAEYTLCSKNSNLSGVIQIIEYPDSKKTNTLDVLYNLKNFPSGIENEFSGGGEVPFGNDYENIAKNFINNDINPFIKKLGLVGDIDFCNKKIPYTTQGYITSDACGSPIENVEIIGPNGEKTITAKDGSYEITGMYTPPNYNPKQIPVNLVELEIDDQKLEELFQPLPSITSKSATSETLSTIPEEYNSSSPNNIEPSEKEIIEAKVIDIITPELIPAQLIDVGTTPTPIETYNKTTGGGKVTPLPIGETNIEEKKEKIKKGIKFKFPEINFPDINLPSISLPKISLPRLFDFNFGWPKFPTNRKLRKKRLKSEEEKFIENNKGKSTQEDPNIITSSPEPSLPIPKSNLIKPLNDENIPKLSCKLNGWCKKSIPLIDLNGKPRKKLNIKLSPFNIKFPKLQRQELIFPDIQLKNLTAPKVNFQMRFQQAMNKLIIRLKTVLIPQIAALLAKFDICDIGKALLIMAAGKKLSELGAKCPKNLEELQKIIKLKNKLTKALNKIYNFLKKIDFTVKIGDKTVTALDIALPALLALTFIPITPVTPLPTATANVVDETKRQVKKWKLIIPGIVSILAIIIELLVKILALLSLLDLLIGDCTKELSKKNPNKDSIAFPTPVENELTKELQRLTQEQADQGSPLIRKVNGFDMAVITIDNIEIDGVKRRRAIAKNPQGIVMLRGEASFSSNDQILIDELVYYIESNDLKAE